MNMFKKLSLSALMLTACFPSVGMSQADVEKALSQMTPEQQEKLVKEAQEQMRIMATQSPTTIITLALIRGNAPVGNFITVSKQVQKLVTTTYKGEQKANLFKMLPSLLKLAFKSGVTVEFSGGPLPKDTPIDFPANCSNLDNADIIILILEMPRTNQSAQEWEGMVFESLGINMLASMPQDNQVKFFEEVLPQLTLSTLPTTLKTFFIDSSKLPQA